jgi:hypothetical protein
MSKRGRPKVEKPFEALLAEDLLFESQKKPFNHVGYALHKNVIKRERLEKGLKQLHEIAFNERLSDRTAKELAIKLGGNI